MMNVRTGPPAHQLFRFIAARDDSGPSDAELLDRYLRTRDDVAFAALVTRHGPMVWGVCRRVLRHHHDAEDAFQATFLILAGGADAITPKNRVANWLYGVAHNLALKARARSVRQRVRECPAPVLPEPAIFDPEIRTDLQPVLDRELSRLPPRYREAILLCDVGDQTYAEAARRLGCPEGTIAARLSRGRALLASRLSRRGVTLSVAGLISAISADRARGVPTELVIHTINLVALAAGGTAGTVPDRVAGLAEGGNAVMLWTRLRVIAAAVALVGVLVVGGGLLLAERLAPLAQPTDERTRAPRGAGDAPANPAADTLRRLEEVKWHLVRVDHEKRALHVADAPDKRSWRSSAAELFAPPASRIELDGISIAKGAGIKLDGKEIPLKELRDGVDVTLKFERERAVVTSIEATTTERAEYVVKEVDVEKKLITVSRDTDNKPLVLSVAGTVPLKEVKPGQYVRLDITSEDGKLIVKGIWNRGAAR
jgi:RNA polymerase sigma factor (sigma-70 family)